MMQNPGAKNLRVTTVAGILVFGEWCGWFWIDVMPEGYVELILQWKDDADKDRVCNWLKDRGIEFVPMHRAY
jgi:hypothetical protein